MLVMGGKKKKRKKKNQFSFRSIKKNVRKIIKDNYIKKGIYIDLEKVVPHSLTNIIRKRCSGFPTGNKGKKKKRRSIIRNERSKCERKFNCKLIYRRVSSLPFDVNSK